MSKDEQFKQAYALQMQEKHDTISASTARATDSRGTVMVLTGQGKGKTSAAFGMVYRSLGHGLRCGVVQFIKGNHISGEVTFLQHLGFLGSGHMAQVDYHSMATGVIWEKHDWDLHKQAADVAWHEALRMMSDPSLDLVVLDELMPMFTYGYLGLDQVLQALEQRLNHQTVVMTGRHAPSALTLVADTISEIADIKHAFKAGVKAQAGIDF